jgi:hypothetical protein
MYRLRFDQTRIIRRGSAQSLLRLFLAGCLLAMLSACTSVKLAYNNTPTLAYWWLDRYVNFEGAQTTEVRDALAQLQQWHRRAELPRLADMLAAAGKQAAGDVTAEQLCSIYRDVRVRLDAFVQQAEPSYVALAMGLKPHQLDNIAARFEKTNAQWREDWIDISPEERLEKRLERGRDRAEDFYGPLQQEQIELMRTMLARSAFDPQRSYRERLRQQQDLLQALRTASQREATVASGSERGTQALRGALQRSMQSPDPAYRAWSEQVVTETCHLMAILHNSTSAAQRNKAAQKMHIHERSLRELSNIG